MNTLTVLFVLSALATIVIAAPNYEEYPHTTRLAPRDFTITQQRNKKSAPQVSLAEKLPEHLEHQESELLTSKVEESNGVARTFGGFKKPVIVKKKVGYHVYRDPEVEPSQVDPLEDSSKHVKVKVCDDKNSVEKMKSSIDETHEEISEREMEHSINVAKEAVQTFERDLNKMEHDCSENNKHRHTTFGSDSQLHDDIAKARQALEHIQRKFKNLESVTSAVDESSPKIHLETKSDEERMIQWKQVVNAHKGLETARNLEDNFKSTDGKGGSQHFKANSLINGDNSFKTNVEETDALSSLNNKIDPMTSIVEDKKPKMNIQSDSLIKDHSENDSVLEKGEKRSRMDDLVETEKKMSEKSTDLQNHEIKNHNEGVQETKQRDIEAKDMNLKDFNLLEKHTKNSFDNEMRKKSDDISTFDNHARTKMEQEIQNGHTKFMHDTDQATHESKNSESVSRSNTKVITRSQEVETINDKHEENNKNKAHSDHENFGLKKSLPKHAETTSMDLSLDENTKNIPKQIDQQRSKQLEAMPISEAHNFKNEDDLGMDTQRVLSSVTSSKFVNENDSEKSNFKNHVVNHSNNDLDHQRASSNFHKELLNNMDFIEDSHHMALHEPSLSETSHMMKHEKPELHERLNIPRVQPNSEHLKSMMHLSDNPHHVSPQKKMASMFNNEHHPDFNVQFNSPQDFVEQTNIQEILPFRSSGHLHKNMDLDEHLSSIHDKDNIPTDLHDSTRWAHSDNMRMDGSSQHFNIEKLTTSRGNIINDQHLNLNDQIRAQQGWAQAKSKNAHHLSPMNTGFDHLHAHNSFGLRNHDHNLMMIENSNIDNTMQPNSFTHMRGAPKMALEYTNPNQWAHNHGSFRTAYGPSIPTSYGMGSASAGSYGGGSTSGGSYGGGSASGGSAVGVFPNANVGNCAVPLLLSCSPSVVSGSLAKTQSSYSAPSYRSEDMNLLKKRGADIDEVTPGLQLQQRTLLGHRPNVFLENNKISVR